MAIFYVNAEMVSRSKGQNVIAKAAYEARTKLLDEQEGRTKDYTKKGGLLHSDIYTPADAPEWMKDRASLWNAVKRKEDESKHWKTAQEARRFIIALPHENSIEKNIELSKKIANIFVNHGMCVDFAVHKPDPNEEPELGKEINYHMHALTTLRNIDTNNIHGFGNKNRSWNDRKYYHDILEKEIAETINQSLPENVQKVEFTPYDETKQSYKGSVHEHSRMITDARERRLKKAQTENKQKENILRRELLRIQGDKYLEQNIKKYAPPTDVGSENQKKAVPQPEPLKPRPVETAVKSPEKTEMKKKKPEPPKNKEEIFVACCLQAKPYISAHLIAEMEDLQKRGESIKKGVLDETYNHDKKIVNITRNLFNEARETRDYEKWGKVFHALYFDPQDYPKENRPQNFKYSNYRYQLWEKISQPYKKLADAYFPEQKIKPTQTMEQDRGGIGR